MSKIRDYSNIKQEFKDVLDIDDLIFNTKNLDDKKTLNETNLKTE